MSTLLAMAALSSSQPQQPRWNAAKGVWEGDRAAGDLEVPSPLHIFGYGSLCWKADFPFAESFVGRIAGWTRVFAQKSTDHRGTPENPGLVATLLSDEERRGLGLCPDDAVLLPSTCVGVCYRVADEDVAAVLDNLDFREKGGYTRSIVEVERSDGGGPPVRALLYTANPANPNFSAQAVTQLESSAQTIASAHGPSGANREYLERLAEWLGTVDEKDEHVARLMELVSAL